MTREELYEQVWSQPMRTLAASIGISDVALAKRCKAANVPVPPRGWWARKEAGKTVKIEPLPPLPFVMSNYFPALEKSEWSVEAQALEPPVFRDLAQVQEEIRAAVKPVRVQPALTRPHPVVARLLKQDSARPPVSGRQFPHYAEQKFGSPIQQRRLRLLSCILTELQRLGCKVSGSTHAGERFSVKVGEGWTYIFLGVEGGASASYFHDAQPRYKQPDREQLRFAIIDHDPRTPPSLSWREDKTLLDQQVSEIIRGIFLQVEDDRRKWALLSYQWRCEDHARKMREAKLAKEKAEADRIAKEKAAAAARLSALIDGAAALERAATIRRYVEKVCIECSARADKLSPDDLERWVSWALSHADAIDPVVSGRFIQDFPRLGSQEASVRNDRVLKEL